MGALRPLHGSHGSQVSDMGADDLVLAFARAYTLSEIFPIRHATVQEAIRDVRLRAAARVDVDVAVAGLRIGGRALGDRHGYLRELGRDLLGLGVTALRLPASLDEPQIEAFLTVLRQAHLDPERSLDTLLEEASVSRIQVAYDGAALPAPTEEWTAAEAWAEPTGEAEEPGEPVVEETVEDMALHAPDGPSLHVSGSLLLLPPAADPFALPAPVAAVPAAPAPSLDPVDERIDLEAPSAEDGEGVEAVWDAFAEPVLEPLDGPFPEAEWLHAAAPFGEDGDPDPEPAQEVDAGVDATIEADPTGIEALAPDPGDDPFVEPTPADGWMEDASAGWMDGLDADWSADEAPMPWEDVDGFWSAPSELDDDAAPYGDGSEGSAEAEPDAQAADLESDVDLVEETWTLLGAAELVEESDEDALILPPEAVALSEERVEPLTTRPTEPVDPTPADRTRDIDEAPAAASEVAPEADAAPQLGAAPELDATPEPDAAPELDAPVSAVMPPDVPEPQGPAVTVSTDRTPPPLHDLPDRDRLGRDPWSGRMIRSERDLAQIAAFRRAIAELEEPRGTAAFDPLRGLGQGVSAPDPAPEPHEPHEPIERLDEDAEGPEDASDAESMAAWGSWAPEAAPVAAHPEPAGPAPTGASTAADRAPRPRPAPSPGAAVPIASLAPDPAPVAVLEPVLDLAADLPAVSATPLELSAPFLADSYQTLAELAIAFLTAPAGRRPAVRAAILERADRLAGDDGHDAVCDAVEALLLGGEAKPEGSVTLARSLCRPPVVRALVQRLGDAKGDEDRARGLAIARQLADLMAVPLANELSEVPPRAARRNYLDALFTMGEHGHAVAVPMLEDSRWFIVRNGVDILGEVGGPGAVDRLTPALAHPDARVRRATVMAMARIGGEEAGTRLLSIVEDPDAQVREAAAMALGHLRVPRALRPLLELLDAEKSDDFQMVILRSLGQIADPSAVPAIEKRALGSFFFRPATAVRIAAYRALAGMGTPHASDLIRQAVDDKNAEVAAAARALVGRL